MKNATMTKAGSMRVERPELEGETVQYESTHPLGLCVKGVYFNGEMVTNIMSFATRAEYIESGGTMGDNPGERGLILE